MGNDVHLSWLAADLGCKAIGVIALLQLTFIGWEKQNRMGFSRQQPGVRSAKLLSKHSISAVVHPELTPNVSSS